MTGPKPDWHRIGAISAVIGVVIAIAAMIPAYIQLFLAARGDRADQNQAAVDQAAIVSSGAMNWQRQAVSPADMGSFGLTNASHERIVTLSLAPTGDNPWGENILDDPLASGQAFIIVYNRANDGCRLDLRVEVADGSTHVMRDVDVCTEREVNFRTR